MYVYSQMKDYWYREWFVQLNPIHTKNNIHKIIFHPHFTIKDLITIILILLIFIYINLRDPYFSGDPDNFKIITPSHIKPECYFLFAYSILRSIPNKLGGVIILFISIFILFLLPLL